MLLLVVTFLVVYFGSRSIIDAGKMEALALALVFTIAVYVAVNHLL